MRYQGGGGQNWTIKLVSQNKEVIESFVLIEEHVNVAPLAGKIGVALAIFAVRLGLMMALNVVDKMISYRVLVTVTVAVVEAEAMRSAIVCCFSGGGDCV